MIGNKERYSCFSCQDSIITRQVDEGTVPYVFDCVMPTCQGLMKRDFNKAGAVGRQPTHEFYLKKEALSDKLSIRKIKEKV